MSNIYCADIGNFSAITALVGEVPRVTRSVVYDATYTSTRDLDSDVSPTVKLDSKVLVLGDRATRQKNAQSAAERGKQLPEFVKPLLLGGLRSDFTGTVRFLVPERSPWDEDALKKLLTADIHEIEVNGKRYKHRIKDVEFYLETDVAIAHAYRTNKIDRDGDTLGIDIGGGTTNFAIMTPGEEVLTRRSIPRVGGVSLAFDVINSDYMQAFARRENVAFTVARAMDAIADGSLTYGRKYDFACVFPGLLENWFNNLIDQITTSANDYMSNVTSIMLFGGNACLVRSSLGSKKEFYIPANPQLSNIEALLEM